MIRFASLLVSVGLAVSLVGCGDSETGGNGGAGGVGGGTGGTGGGAMVTVSGTVVAVTIDGPSTPVENATVSVLGTSATATTDAQGSFSLETPAGVSIFVGTADGNWGALFAENVPAQGLNDLEIEVIPDELVDGIAAALSLLTPPSTSNGLVGVDFGDGIPVGGETASVDVSTGSAFVFDDQDEPALGDTLIAGGGSEVIFLDVEVSSQVTVTATSADDAPCPLVFPSVTYPVQAKVLTEIPVACPAQ